MLMEIQEHVALEPYNTFGIEAKAEKLLELTDKAMLEQISNNNSLPAEKHVIGGGSNILFTKDVDGLTILNKLKGIEHIKDSEDYIWLKVASGEVWHELVMYAIERKYAGIENLALIPGTVGAAPMQNIGAYGVEVKELIEEVTAWHWGEKKFVTYTNKECQFGYRDSVFKHELKGKVFITDVVFRLFKQPRFNTKYGAIQQELENKGVTELSIEAIAEAVISIRKSKLPDPEEIGNAGSFFKNPTVSIDTYLKLHDEFPEMPSYTIDDETVKIPAGWMIEHCGYKGHTVGNTGVHEKQALVLVNKGGAKGREVYNLSEEILQTVKEKFNIELEREVQVW